MDSISGDWQATFQFLWMFAAGRALSYRPADIVRLMKTCNRGATVGLWALSILLLIVPFNRVWGDFLIGGCAALLICLCLDRDRITAALVVPPALWLGRVSYSLYLIHLPILIFATTSGFGGIGRLPVFIVTLVLAELTYRLLEQPSRWIGIKISNVPGPPRRPI